MADTSPDWSDLTKIQQEQIQLALFSLKEFSYGLERLDEISEGVAPGSATMRFYFNSLYQYVVSYFAVGGTRKLSMVLRDIGLGGMLEPVQVVLDEPLGDTTLGSVLKELRDKFLVHQSFRMDVLEERVFQGFDPEDPATAARIMDLIHDLFMAVRALYVEVGTRYPQAC